jgi:hypothetical protein
VATPICRNIREVLETVRYTMINLLFVRICLVVGFADALRENFWITIAMTSVFAVFTLHTRAVFEEFAAKRTAHDIVELLRDELVALTNSTLPIKANIEWSTIFHLFGCVMFR